MEQAVEGGEVLISATIIGLGRGPVDTDGMARSPPTAPMRQPSLGISTEREGAHACMGEWHVTTQQREEGVHAPERRHASCDLLGRDRTPR